MVLCDSVGCTDPAADNFNDVATTDDGSCIRPGCTNPQASNYLDKATKDDGSCVILGCTNFKAANYDPTATVEDLDEPCVIIGCMESTARNYDADATQPRSCLAAEAPYASTLYRDFRSLGFTVATPMGVQRVFPSSQLIVSRIYFRLGELPCESRGSQVAHQMRCKRGQLLPRLLVRKHRMPQRTGGSTECLDPCLLANSLHSKLLPPLCYIMVALGRLLQTPSGVQEVTPSTQQMLPASF